MKKHSVQLCLLSTAATHRYPVAKPPSPGPDDPVGVHFPTPSHSVHTRSYP